MDLFIRGLWRTLDADDNEIASGAIDHQPDKPTYAIQVLSSGDTEIPQLVASSLYRTVHQYVFDDVWPGVGAGRMIDSRTAESIVTDFREGMGGCEALLVHCSRGRNRAPAVAIALTEVFSLGHDVKALKELYGGPNGANWYVYRMITDAAKRLQLP